MNETRKNLTDRIKRIMLNNSCFVATTIIVVFLLFFTGNAFGARLQVITVEKDGTMGVLSEYRPFPDNSYRYPLLSGRY